MNLDLIPNHIEMILEENPYPNVSEDDRDTMEKVALLLTQLPETTPQDIAQLFDMFYDVHQDEFIGNPKLDLNLVDLTSFETNLNKIMQDFSLKGLKQDKIDEILSSLAHGASLDTFIEFLENISDNVEIDAQLFLDDIIYNYVQDPYRQPEVYIPKARKLIALLLQKYPTIEWGNFVDEINEINDEEITAMVGL